MRTAIMTIEQKLREDFISPILDVDVLELLSYRRTYPYDEALMEGYAFREGDYYVSDFHDICLYRPFVFVVNSLPESSLFFYDFRIVWAAAGWHEQIEWKILQLHEEFREARKRPLALPPQKNARAKKRRSKATSYRSPTVDFIHQTFQSLCMPPAVLQ